MHARLLLAALLPLATLLAGCTGPVPGAESECRDGTPAPATFEAEYAPLVEPWDAVPVFESNGWVLEEDAGGATDAEHVIAYVSYRADGDLLLRGLVAELRSEDGERVVGTLVRVAAPGSAVGDDAEAETLLRPHVLPIEQGFAEMLGAPTRFVGYAGGARCPG